MGFDPSWTDDPRDRGRELTLGPTGGGIDRTSSCWWTTDMVPTTCCVWSSRRRSLDRRHGSCLAIEHDELDFERRAVRVDANDGSNVAANQIPAGYGGRQHDSIEFPDHSTQRLQ